MDESKLNVNLDNIPEAMTMFDNWVCWKLETKTDGTLAKVPYIFTDKLIRRDEKHYSELMAFLDAVCIAEEYKLSGIGFAFVGDGICGIDVDHCVIDNKLTDEATKLIEQFKDTYCEYSPSGTGIHIYFHDNDLAGFKNRKQNGYEIYYEKRYFTVTGNKIEGTGNTIHTYNGGAKKFVAEYIGINDNDSLDDSQRNEIIKSHTFKPAHSDEELLNIINQSKNADKFNVLFKDGNISDYGNDDSAADMALMCHLAYWTNCNATQMASIFSKSKLAQRDKWSRDDYRKRTIAAAIKTQEQQSPPQINDKNEVEKSIEILNSIKDYTPADVLNEEVFKAAALCKLKAPVYFDSFKKICKLNKIDMSTFNGNVDTCYKQLKKAEFRVISKKSNIPVENDNVKKDLPPLPDNMKFNFETPTGYVMDATGIYQNTKDGLKRISRSAIIVSKLIRNIDEGICKTQLACCKYGKKWITAPAVDNNIIASKQKIVSMSDYDIDITSNNAGAIIEFIAEFTAFNIDNIPKASSVNQTGWRKDEAFVYPNTDSDYVLDDSIKFQLDKIFAVEGKKENVISLIHKIKKVDISNFNLGATLAAPLVHILNIDNIVVHTYGLAGSGKTIQNTFLFSLFGNPKANLAIPGADATRVGLENLFAGRHDLPAFIEDLNAVKGDKKFQSIVQQLPYQFGNGTGRLRGKPKGGNQNLIDIRGTLLTTDEKPLTTDTSAGGGKRRVIELKTPNEMFDSETAAEIDDTIRKNYGLFGREWIELIKEKRANMKDMYDELRKGTKDSPGLQQEFVNKVPRHIQSVAAITTANIFFDVNLLNIDFKTAYEKEIDCARRILQSLPDKSEIADFERAKPIIIDWFLQHRKKFVDDSAYEENSPQYNETKSFEEYGIIKKDFIAVNTSVFRKMLNDNDFSPDIVIRQLIDNGFLLRSGKNLEKQIRVKWLDNPIRMTCIDKSKIEKMASE